MFARNDLIYYNEGEYYAYVLDSDNEYAKVFAFGIWELPNLKNSTHTVLLKHCRVASLDEILNIEPNFGSNYHLLYLSQVIEVKYIMELNTRYCLVSENNTLKTVPKDNIYSCDRNLSLLSIY